MMMVVLFGMVVAILTGVVVLVLAFWDVAFDGASATSMRNADVRERGSERSTPNGNRCPNGGQHLISVTPPEAFAIAEVLRRTLPVIELEQVRSIATRNKSRRQMCVGLESTQADMTCPLLSSDECCLAYGVRPLCCRCPPKENPRHVGANPQHLGQEEGIVKGLATTGLQSGVYELNEALTKVLGVVDTPQRWAAGERVFAD